MSRFYFIVWSLLAVAASGRDCTIAAGPEGLCIAIRLAPRYAELTVGGTLQIQVSGLDCVNGGECTDCTSRRRRVRWVSTAPEVAAVDSTGLIRAMRPGVADIRLVSEEAGGELLAGMRVVVGRANGGGG